MEIAPQDEDGALVSISIDRLDLELLDALHGLIELFHDQRVLPCMPPLIQQEIISAC